MAGRLFLLCQAATAATRRVAFPADEPAERVRAERLAELALRLPRRRRAFVSPSMAARQTADALGLAASLEPALAGLDYGRWRGRSFAEVESSEPEALAHWLARPAAAPHGGESIASLRRRAGAWLNRMAAEDGTVVAVTSADFIQAAIAAVLGAPASSFWRTSIAPLQLVTLTRSGFVWTLRTMTPARTSRRSRIMTEP